MNLVSLFVELKSVMQAVRRRQDKAVLCSVKNVTENEYVGAMRYLHALATLPSRPGRFTPVPINWVAFMASMDAGRG
jgi:hypothetical protein